MSMKYRIWSKSSKCYTNDPGYPGASFHCASNYYLDQDGNLVDFVTTIGGDPDDATKGPIDQDDYIIEQCTGYKATDGQLLYVGDLVEFPLGIKRSCGRIIFDHFCFWIVEKQGGVLKFDQKEYTRLGNHNVNPEALWAKTEQTHEKGGH